MGSYWSIFENKSNTEIEIRVFVPPARPDKYKKIIRIKPDEVKLLKTKEFTSCEQSTEYPVYLMVFMDGVYTGTTLFSSDIKKYAKILSYMDDDGYVRLKGIRIKFPSFCMRV